jgi:hypothetical protein
MRRLVMSWFLFGSLTLTAADWLESWWGSGFFGSDSTVEEQGEVRALEGGNGTPPCCP